MTQTKFKPILFSTPMVQAILEGRKTQTRRKNNHPYFSKEELLEHTLPKYQVGDVLWVREGFYEPILEELNGKYYYKADLEKQGWDFKWKPSIFMPKEACRLFLKVTNVRLERLQDISEADAIAEGVEKGLDMNGKYKPMYRNYLKKESDGSLGLVVFNARTSFITLWLSIHGMDSWSENPYVWVYDFERINKPADF